MLDHITFAGGTAAQAILTQLTTIACGVAIAVATDASKSLLKRSYRRFLRAPIKRGDRNAR